MLNLGRDRAGGPRATNPTTQPAFVLHTSQRNPTWDGHARGKWPASYTNRALIGLCSGRIVSCLPRRRELRPDERVYIMATWRLLGCIMSEVAFIFFRCRSIDLNAPLYGWHSRVAQIPRGELKVMYALTLSSGHYTSLTHHVDLERDSL